MKDTAEKATCRLSKRPGLLRPELIASSDEFGEVEGKA